MAVSGISVASYNLLLHTEIEAGEPVHFSPLLKCHVQELGVAERFPNPRQDETEMLSKSIIT